MRFEIDVESERDSAAVTGFCRRLIAQVVSHKGDNVGIPGQHAYALQSLGVLTEADVQLSIDDLANLIGDPSHPKRIGASNGPFVFVGEDKQITSIDVSECLLHPDSHVRHSALEYLQQGSGEQEPWITTYVAEAIATDKEAVVTGNSGEWREAAARLQTMLADDVLANIARFRQLANVDYVEEAERCFNKILWPTLDMLQHVRPDLYCPSQQTNDLLTWIDGLAATSSLNEALTAFYKLAGHVPLARPYNFAALMDRWSEIHGHHNVAWSELRDWATSIGTPMAEYHATVIALDTRKSERSDGVGEEWIAVLDILASITAETTTPTQLSWLLFNKLSHHFARHIECLHPGQFGERVACYAWWLADKIGRALLSTKRDIAKLIAGPIEVCVRESWCRWLVARSRVEPSSFRYMTIYLKSPWAMSLITLLAQPRIQRLSEDAHIAGHVLQAIYSCLYSAPLSMVETSRSTIYAHEELVQYEDVFRHYSENNETPENILNALEHHNLKGKPNELLDRMHQVPSMSADDQYKFIVFVRCLILSSSEYDEVVAKWITESDLILNMLSTSRDESLKPMMEILGECQQRLPGDIPMRIPNLLSYAVECADTAERASKLWGFAFMTALNVGLVSPIQRIAVSKWRGRVIKELRELRDTLQQILPGSEPWVAGRIRATSAAVSRIVGPRTRSVDIAANANGLEHGKNM